MSTDYELLDHWQAGDRGAGNQLFERYFRSICRFFDSKIQGSDVEELVQTTFMACMDTRDTFRRQSSFRTYLFSIARYQLYGYFRRRQRSGQQLDFGATSVADMGTSPRSLLARHHDNQLLLAALCSLPLEQQLLLELYYWEEMQMSELAELFEIQPTTVRTRLFRAREALRQKMARLATSPDAPVVSMEDLDAWARRLRDQMDALPQR